MCAITRQASGCRGAYSVHYVQLWPRGYMFAVDLGPGASQDFMRSLKYEENVGELHNMLNILH